MNEKSYATMTYVIFRHVPIVEGSMASTMTITFNENHTKEHGNSSRAHDCYIERSTKGKKVETLFDDPEMLQKPCTPEMPVMLVTTATHNTAEDVIILSTLQHQ